MASLVTLDCLLIATVTCSHLPSGRLDVASSTTPGRANRVEGREPLASIGKSAGGVKKHQDATPPRSLGRRKGETDMTTRKRIAAWVRYEIRHRDGSSQREFAHLLDLSHTYINRILSEEQTAGMELLIAMHRKLGVSADKLLDRDPPEEFFQQDSEKV